MGDMTTATTATTTSTDAGAAGAAAAASGAAAASTTSAESSTQATQGATQAAQTTAQNGAAAKADEAKAAAPTTAAPADIELKLPDGFKADETSLKDLKATAKELGLDSTKTQKILDLYVKQQQAEVLRHNEQLSKWEESLKTDKAFGGEQFKANVETAKKALEHFAAQAGESGKEAINFLRETGLGSHPGLVRVFHAIGKAMANDSVKGGTKFGGAEDANSEEARMRRAYPNSPDMFQH
jgi:hypothetical protein